MRAQLNSSDAAPDGQPPGVDGPTARNAAAFAVFAAWVLPLRHGKRPPQFAPPSSVGLPAAPACTRRR